jgi:hypothetical protein
MAGGADPRETRADDKHVEVGAGGPGFRRIIANVHRQGGFVHPSPPLTAATPWEWGLAATFVRQRL